MSRHYSCGRGPSADLMLADADYPRTWNLWIRTPLLVSRLAIKSNAKDNRKGCSAGSKIWGYRPYVYTAHRRRSSVNFGGQDIFARKYMYGKLTKFPNFSWRLPKNIFPDLFISFFFGGGGYVPPVSYTPLILLSWLGCMRDVLVKISDFIILRQYTCIQGDP